MDLNYATHKVEFGLSASVAIWNISSLTCFKISNMNAVFSDYTFKFSFITKTLQIMSNQVDK